MRTLLYIGEAAQLVGITPKTIRHYQKVGLLPTPKRDAAGYRLYSAHDLLRLHHIRRLQSLGLSLKQIKTVLGDSGQKHTLRDVLEALDDELHAQIQILQERRKKIRQLLDSSALETAERLPVNSPTFEWAKQQLGKLVETISPELLEQEARMDELLDAFQWPGGYQESMKQVTQYLVKHPEIHRHLVAWGERFAALAHLPEDSPEVEHFLEICQDDEALLALRQMIMTLSTQFPSMDAPFSQTLADVLASTLSPTQQRLLEEIKHRDAGQQSST